MHQRKLGDKSYPMGVWGILIIVCFLWTIFGASCDSNQSATKKIPMGIVSINIDLNLPSYMHLVNPGSYSYFEGGIKGVLVIHDYDDNWYAFERGCAFEPTKACSKIWADSISIQLRCGSQGPREFLPCCQSKYTFGGYPTEGEARGRLGQYTIQRSGNALSVYN
ncbi:MAG: hypothetical protein CK532_00050 [Flavobacteriales bacterium]|nr:MAG: hypothetical protein CK532_00050 [Flavobacteriales bacterium]